MRTVLVSVAEVKHETDLAFLFILPSDTDGDGDSILDEKEGEKVWVPKSVIEGAEHVYVGDEDIEVSIAEWFCEKEGLA